MDLDFSALSDDQVVGLIRSACVEAVRRGTACESAARDAYLSAAERAQVAREAASVEADRLRHEEEQRVARDAAERVRQAAAVKATEDQLAAQRQRWGRRKGVALAVKSVVTDWCDFPMVDRKGNAMVLELWQKGAERRVFIGYGFNHGIVAYHVTGGGQGRYAKPPKHLENDRADKEVRANAAKLGELCQAIADLWPTAVTKILLADALAWEGDAIPLPGFVPPPIVLVTPPPVPAEPTSPVELPVTLRFERRSGIPLVVCCSCGRFASPDVPAPHMTHSTRCDTPAAQIPAGWPVPAATHAVEEQAPAMAVAS